MRKCRDLHGIQARSDYEVLHINTHHAQQPLSGRRHEWKLPARCAHNIHIGTSQRAWLGRGHPHQWIRAALSEPDDDSVHGDCQLSQHCVAGLLQRLGGVPETIQRLLPKWVLSWSHDARLRQCARRGDEHLPPTTVPTMYHAERVHDNGHLMAMTSRLCVAMSDTGEIEFPT